MSDVALFRIPKLLWKRGGESWMDAMRYEYKSIMKNHLGTLSMLVVSNMHNLDLTYGSLQRFSIE